MVISDGYGSQLQDFRTVAHAFNAYGNTNKP